MSAEMVKETDLLWDNLIIKEEEWKMQASKPNEKSYIKPSSSHYLGNMSGVSVLKYFSTPI